MWITTDLAKPYHSVPITPEATAVKHREYAMRRQCSVEMELLESLTGQLQATSLAIPTAPEFTRDLYDLPRLAKAKRQIGAQRTAEAVEIAFWTLNIRSINGTRIRGRAETAVINVDASATSVGAVMEEKEWSELLPRAW